MFIQGVIQVVFDAAILDRRANSLEKIIEADHLELAALEPFPKHSVKRLTEILRLAEIPGEFLEDLVGIQLAPTATVPSRVAETIHGSPSRAVRGPAPVAITV